MLEVFNLTKVYKTKGGADVNALDGVSLRFPERGMVFLLGKSGSGKSTLLNVCGGLDTPTSGEIIVKGRSSRDFTGSDFDSYRNTFIGFIFQEYNILNEFSVEDNIALALELQGKPKDRAAVDALLEQVDLLGYAKRKPNTLSGGQKQRIAIARALIKSPEIIMADEPTGALDSATGKQVFDTLKRLSRDKLVIIVSHDRDFAEQYGDRIIELKDGRILSDVSKTVEVQEAISENVTSIGDTLCIKRGSELSERDFARIKEFLKSTPSDVVITGGEREVRAFREVNRMTEDGGQEVFRGTDEGSIPKKSYSPEDSRFIASKLPMRHAARIGLSGLKTKPFRLAFTAFLCTVALILFGLLSTLTFYDSTATFRETLLDSDYELLSIGKTYRSTMKIYEYGQLINEYESGGGNTLLSPADLAALSTSLGTPAFGAVYADTTASAQVNSSYYSTMISSLADAAEAEGVLGAPLHGRYPTAKGEIMLSSYLADSFIGAKAYDKDETPISLSSREELIGKEFALDLTSASGDEDVFRVVGIFKSPDVPERFAGLKDTDANDHSLRNEFEEWLRDGISGLALLHTDVLADAAKRHNFYTMGADPFESHYLVVADERQADGSYGFSSEGYQNGYYTSLSEGQGYTKVYLESGKTALGEREALMNAEQFYERLSFLASHRGEQLGSALGDTYRRDEHASAIAAAREAAGIFDTNTVATKWADAFVGTPYTPTADLAEAYSTAMAEAEAAYGTETEAFLAAFFDRSERDILQEKLVNAGVSENDAAAKLDDWIELINRGDGENRPNNDPNYAVFQELERLMAKGSDRLWRSPLMNRWCDAIDEARGVYLDHDELLGMWEAAYIDGNTAYYEATAPESLRTAYGAWKGAFAEVAPTVAKLASLLRIYDICDALRMGRIYDEEQGQYHGLTEAEKKALAAELAALYAGMRAELPITVSFKLYDGNGGMAYGETETYTVVGMFEDDEYSTRLLLPDAAATALWQDQMAKVAYYVDTESRYVQATDAIYAAAYFAYDHSEAMTDYLTALYEERGIYDDSDSNYVITSGLAATFEMVDSMVSQFKQIFLYVGLAMAVFAALLLSNFISVSISHKRREIGILRAVGARSLDVFKIFFSESFFITVLCVVLSLVGSLVICGIVNGILNDLLGASLFVFGILSVLVLIAVALVTAILATFLPVYQAARRKPVESIRAL